MLRKSIYIRFISSLFIIMLLSQNSEGFLLKTDKYPPAFPAQLTAASEVSSAYQRNSAYHVPFVKPPASSEETSSVLSATSSAESTASSVPPTADPASVPSAPPAISPAVSKPSLRKKPHTASSTPVSSIPPVSSVPPPVPSASAVVSFAPSVTSSVPSTASPKPSASSSAPVSSTPSATSSVRSAAPSESSAASFVPPAASAAPSVTSTVPPPAPSVPLPSAPAAKIIAGYYAGWSAYSGYTPADIPAQKLTHVNYAFAKIGSDLKIALGDPSIDISNFAKLNTLKAANPHLKTLISVGGWTFSDQFSDAALTDASRIVFADSVVEFIKKYNFNGVDIDWEYPVSGGLSTNTYRPADKANFTLLIKKLREKLDAQGVADGKKYLLTFAGGAGNTYIKNVELEELSRYVNYAIIMTYDLHGSWDTYTDFNAPLYKPSTASPQYKVSVDSCVNAWIAAGFPASKLVLGVPFYGYMYSGVANANNGLFQPYTSCKSIPYDKIVSLYLNHSAYTKYDHSEAKVPYLFNGSVFITYDDADSVAEKADYANSKKLAGVCAWELSQNKDKTLISVLNASIQ